jgi:hypothetical protein
MLPTVPGRQDLETGWIASGKPGLEPVGLA